MIQQRAVECRGCEPIVPAHPLHPPPPSLFSVDASASQQSSEVRDGSNTHTHTSFEMSRSAGSRCAGQWVSSGGWQQAPPPPPTPPRPGTWGRARWLTVPTVRRVLVPALPASLCLFASAIWGGQLRSTSSQLSDAPARPHIPTHPPKQGQTFSKCGAHAKKKKTCYDFCTPTQAADRPPSVHPPLSLLLLLFMPSFLLS